MSRSFGVAREYDVTPGQLFAAVTDLGFLTARAERFGGDGPPSVEGAGATTTTVTVPRRLPLEHVPGPFRGVLGDGRVVQVDEWAADGAGFGSTWRIDAGATPVALAGTASIAPTDTGCRYAIAGDIRVRLALIGGQAEKLAASNLEVLLTEELAFLRDWLRAR